MPLQFSQLVEGYFYKAVFLFPGQFVDGPSPLTQHQRHAQYPVFRGQHMSRVNASGLFLNHQERSPTLRHPRPVLVTGLDLVSQSIIVMVCSSSPRTGCPNAHRWAPIGAAPHLPHQPGTGVGVVPSGALDNGNGYLCFSHVLEVSLVVPGDAALPATAPGAANIQLWNSNRMPANQGPIKCGNFQHVLDLNRAYWDGKRYTVRGQDADTGMPETEGDDDTGDTRYVAHIT